MSELEERKTELDRIRTFDTALQQFGGELSLADITEIEEYIFEHREPSSNIIRAIITDSLAMAVAQPPIWHGLKLIFRFGRRRAAAQDIQAIARFVLAAVPMEAVGAGGYRQWLSAAPKQKLCIGVGRVRRGAR